MTSAHGQSPGGASCRAVLLEVLANEEPLRPGLQAHLEGCAFCMARWRAARALSPWLRQRPPVVAAPDLLAGIYERAIEAAERAPAARLLASAVPPPATDLDAAAWPDSLLASDLAHDVITVPPAAGEVSWARVRTGILDQVAQRPGSPRRRPWWIGVAGAAAVASLVFLVSREPSRPAPTITFQDLDRLPAGGALPGVDFAVVRYGATR